MWIAVRNRRHCPHVAVKVVLVVVMSITWELFMSGFSRLVEFVDLFRSPREIDATR